jgi:hypothetical protein
MICPKCGHVTESRSDKQHGLMRAWNRILARHFGESEDYMLGVIFERCGIVESHANPFTGEVEYRRKSTKDLTDDEAAAILSEMDQVALEYMNAPLPKLEGAWQSKSASPSRT